ncbi:MAG: DNA alkylation repair protein [Candidatus Diapherotrites archaeon]|nr:DNA alkylation repair protein [Candidatus Diapherotrites archaeon]
MGLRFELSKLANPERARLLQGFFKTGKGEYAEGDIFLGISVPETRRIAKKFSQLSLAELQKNLESKYHEERLAALLILEEKFRKSPKAERKRIFEFYLENAQFVNNWDLVDLTAPKILGEFLVDKDRKILYALAKSRNLWERRIAVLSTLAFIRRKEFEDSLKIARILLSDSQDLIHKAVGWMLREVGKKDKKALLDFLKENHNLMPRTMLRYSIEKFPEKERKELLAGKV